MTIKYLPQTVRQHIKPLYSTDGQPMRTRKVPVKYFAPGTGWTWFVLEGEPVHDMAGREVDFRFFGLVQGLEDELGYFMLRELEQALYQGCEITVVGDDEDNTETFQLHVERDIYWNPETTLEQAAPEFMKGRYER